MELADELDRKAVQDYLASDNLPAWAHEVHARIDAEGLFLDEYEPQEILSYAAYRQSLPEWVRPYADAWDSEIRKLRRRAKVSASAVWRLEGYMRVDVYETYQTLKDASPEVRDAWAGWYVRWVQAELARHLERLPWLGKSAEQRHRERRDHYRRKTERKREQTLDARLLDHVEVRGGSVVWDVEHLRKAVANGGRAYKAKALDASVERLSALGLLRKTRRPKSYQPGELSRLVLLAGNASESYEAHCNSLKKPNKIR
jgi:hypothetical protein